MKDIYKINDKHELDLISLSNFLDKNNDSYLYTLLTEKDLIDFYNYNNIIYYDYYNDYYDYKNDKIDIDYIFQKYEEYLPNGYKTFKDCRKRLIEDISNIKHIPLGLRFYDFCLIVANYTEIERDSNNWLISYNSKKDFIKYIPTDIEEYEYLIQLASFRNNSYITHLPRNSKAYYDILKINPKAIRFIPEYKRTENICNMATQIALNSNMEHIYIVLEYIPDKYKTNKMCIDFFNRDTMSFIYIPDKYKTYKMCNIAVKFSEHFITYVPNEYIAQLKKEFPKSVIIQRYNDLQEYIQKEVKKLLREYYLK
jgi:hypothetical protein